MSSRVLLRMQVENWAAENHLSRNQTKSVEIVFVSPWNKRAVIISSPSVPGFVRAESTKAIGVTKAWKTFRGAVVQ